MVESLIELMQSLPVWAVLACTFLIAYVENLFPPSPSDLLLAFIGTLVGMGTVGLIPTLTVASAGSITGFATAYWIGRRYGRELLESRWVPFVTSAMIDRVNVWFDKYHGLIIIGNRFLAGTRAVIAFAAGMARLPFPRTLVYSAISATAWNLLLLYAGVLLGSRWQKVADFLAIYGWVVAGLLAALAVVLIVRKWKRRPQGAAVEEANSNVVGPEPGGDLLDHTPVDQERKP